MLDKAEVASALIARTRDAADPDDLQGALCAVTRAVVELGVADLAGMSEHLSGGLHSLAPTDAMVEGLDKLQHDLKEGPCVDAAYSDGVLVSGDIGDDPRWPEWGPRAVTHGINAVISVHLYTAGSASGALNLYRRDRQDYTTNDLDIARMAGAHASTVLVYYRNDVNLTQAVEARHVIGQAQGILMERYGIGSDQSFAVMRRISQDNNVKLHRVAEHIASTGELPDGVRAPVPWGSGDRQTAAPKPGEQAATDGGDAAEIAEPASDPRREPIG